MTRQERSVVVPSRSGALSARARITACQTSARSRRPGPLETARSAGGVAVARLTVFTAATLPEFGGSDDSVSFLQRVRSRRYRLVPCGPAAPRRRTLRTGSGP